MTQVGHWNPRIPCETCRIKFHTQEAAKQHMTATNHYKKYCKPCDQRFSSENDLKMHLGSNAHRCAKGSGHASKRVVSVTHDNIASQPYASTTLNLKHVKPAATVNENSPKPTEYTVGWICALPVEMSAAEAMLDEEFQYHGQNALDENIYAVGRIAHLNTVIACLPSGVAGTTSATRVAEHMRQTFTALQYILLVGVGGGMPSKEVDVRLGDVVVSIPSSNSPGVVQYDYGKDVQNDRFVTTGHLNQPPTRLLNAISRLRSLEASRSSGMMFSVARSIARLQARYSNSERNWSYPGEQNDILFNSDYNHEEECLTCARCDSNYLEERLRRGSTQPKIHYGTIASANRVMRNGAARERLRSDKNALCVEMEAAGLMNNFHCLVIRGICDYADSHKNKDWQPYAAAAAAAYAKELLSVMPKHT
ncbi:nucleoside phosphorylase domain-containing protein [Fusarium flagelliforme]|uniref:nucleoside phosphorylase domain-containing protein n=1 Tax=Fusarium flagelliforme TaxID=2675880 RepID=UPI001E8D2CEF|nr:nucleoside phosphorylase domain-containing protein [Fusarium flagelliforme]KAH7174061.1 nucleoside phosphorylase domain-containing protein [Fusarium flagelliforme]